MPCHSKWPNLVRNRRFGQFEFHTLPVSGHRIAKSWHERGDLPGDIAVICIKPDHGKRIAHQLQALGIPHLLMADRNGKRAYDPGKPQINILSVQSSKGLEFRSVIFIGLGQITSEEQAAQNMKLLYVERRVAGSLIFSG